MYYEELSQAFAEVPLEVYGIYRTQLESGIYRGHAEQPTTRSALLIPLQGSAEFYFDDQEAISLKPGKALIGGKGMRLELEVGEEGFVYFLAHFLPYDGCHELSGKLTGLSVLELQTEPGHLMLMDQLLQLDGAPGQVEKLEKKALFYQLAGKVLSSERAFHNRQSSDMVQDAIRYITTCYMDAITLESLSTRYDLKPKYFSFLFQKYVGISPIHYLIQYRMLCAQKLLLTGQYPVSDVARSVGYSDAYYFSRLFKKHTGIPPSQASLFGMRNNPSLL
ncbi:helix-turn-helix transcriptional regulator [Paenibacillus sp. CAU 1782]